MRKYCTDAQLRKIGRLFAFGGYLNPMALVAPPANFVSQITINILLMRSQREQRLLLRPPSRKVIEVWWGQGVLEPTAAFVFIL
jgi:hypothetical protein